MVIIFLGGNAAAEPGAPIIVYDTRLNMEPRIRRWLPHAIISLARIFPRRGAGLPDQIVRNSLLPTGSKLIRDPPALDRDFDQLNASAQPKFFHGTGFVGFHGFRADAQLRPDFFRGESLRNEANDFHLAFA